jgi:hypothetical protein
VRHRRAGPIVGAVGGNGRKERVMSISWSTEQRPL